MATSVKTEPTKKRKYLLMAVLCLTVPACVHAEEIPPPAYQLAAQRAGVPSEVLYAVALTESGLRMNKGNRKKRIQLIPWPWTLNIAGKGRFFKTRSDACNVLVETLKTVPAKRVDVGLGQINYGYHAERIPAPCDLLDPYLNLSIAAEILKEQHREWEDWLVAIGRYHAPADMDRAVSYRNMANRHLVRIAAATP